MDLSVIIVNWNTEELLRNCLRSVYGTIEGLDFEVIVVDNASADGSVAMLKEPRLLAAMLKDVKLSADRLSSVVRIGGVYPEILAEAKEWGADLVVIGSHRPAMSTYLLGSNATTVVRHATCSVLVVRE